MKPKPPDVVYVVTATPPGGKGKPPPPPPPPAGKRPKMEKAPPAWEKLNQASRASLLRTEARALLALRKGVIGIVSELSRELGKLTGSPEAKRTVALGAIKRAQGHMASTVEAHVLSGRHMARDAASARVKAAVEQLHKELTLRGFDKALLPMFPKRTEGATDAAFAHSVAQSYASSWSKAALSKTLEWEKRPALSLSAAIDRTVEQTDGRLRRIARTEVRGAFNAEHTTEMHSMVEKGAGWRRHVMRRWDATLDGKLCQACFRHHGEIVPLGKPFSGGDEPANMHPHCRCIDTIVVLPQGAGA